MLCLVVSFGATACQLSQPKPSLTYTTTIPASKTPPLFATPTVTPAPVLKLTPWPLEIEIGTTTNKTTPTCAQLTQIEPGKSTLEDVYAILGYPDRRRDFSTGIVLGYGSQHIKFNHIVLIDGITGDVKLVGIVNCDNFGRLLCTTFNEEYGEPVLAVTNGNRKHWFFEDHDIADTGMIRQILPPGTTLEQYRDHNGYFDESYAFTP
jgi:hypothetical protein